MKPQAGSLKKISKIDKPLVTPIRKKKTPKTPAILGIRGDIIRDYTDSKTLKK